MVGVPGVRTLIPPGTEGGPGGIAGAVAVPGGRTVGVDVSARIHGPSPQLELAFHLERRLAIE